MELDQLEMDPLAEAWARAAVEPLAAQAAARELALAGVECAGEAALAAAAGGCATALASAGGEVSPRLPQLMKGTPWSSSRTGCNLAWI